MTLGEGPEFYKSAQLISNQAKTNIINIVVMSYSGLPG